MKGKKPLPTLPIGEGLVNNASKGLKRLKEASKGLERLKKA